MTDMNRRNGRDEGEASKKANLPKIENPAKFFTENEKRAESKVQKYWRSLNVLNNSSSEEVIRSKREEFPEGQDGEINLDKMDGVSRRKFLALMTASGVFATAACTNYRDKGEIINYTKKPESIQPGIASYYASTLFSGGMARGVLIKTREGRPIKVDGNPDHPIGKGKIDPNAQAMVLDLYDPARTIQPMKSGGDKFEATSWKMSDKRIMSALKSASSEGKEIAVITHSTTSPTSKKLMMDFVAKYPTTKIYSYDLFSNENKNSAWEKSYGKKTYPGVQLDKADVILSIDNDFLASDGDTVEAIRQFASRRNVDDLDNFNRLYSVSSAYTTTSGMADYHMRLRPEMMFEFAMSLASELSGGAAFGVNLSSYNLSNFAKSYGMVAKKISQLVSDLSHAKGKAIVVGGSHLGEKVHLAINLLNEILTNTEIYNSDNAFISQNDEKADWDALVSNMNAGNVGVVINMDANPVYHLAPDYGFESAIKKVKTVVTLAGWENETSAVGHFLLPINHAFESWGDHNQRSGIISLQQPVISPLYDTRQCEAILLNWIMGGNSYDIDIYHKYLMTRWESEVYTSIAPASSFTDFWYHSLHDGVVTYSENNSEELVFDASALNSARPDEAKGWALVLTKSPHIEDGRHANNGFLQETPHPITKMTWDNCAMISPDSARTMNLSLGDFVDVSLGGRNLKLPVVVQPGMAANTVTIDLGYGRRVAPVIGKEVGFDANVLTTKNGGLSQFVYTGADVKASGGEKHPMGSTQEHHQLDEEVSGYKIAEFHKVRHIIQESTVLAYKHDKEVISRNQHHTTSIMDNHVYPGVKWAMAIDLNKCSGCNACVTACNIESNVPVVGKGEVLVGREMQWMRLDRYYAGDEESPRMSLQPMLCAHCDNAPCENVCPVVATTHSDEGINQMVYNRCVGTRYCANNCPYKVRRFNFFDFRDWLAEGYYYEQSAQQMFNPEITVRSRGVMEKCDFCSARVATAKTLALHQGREFKGSDVRTACQEACPAEAIYFGDSNDPNSDVSKLREHNLGYEVLTELDHRSNVTYIAKLINSNEDENNSNGGSH
jgi:MoCo/4Fe-4S cofactor protein with predicted Tat translocation signal